MIQVNGEVGELGARTLKVRKTGIFWWSPFERNRESEPVPRKTYEVERRTM